MLNEEHIPIPSDYHYARLGKVNPRVTNHLWNDNSIKKMLNNPLYLGHLVQLRVSTVSYKNHKVIKRDEEDMIAVRNTHEPIITQELWDKVKEVEASVSQGKRTHKGVTLPLSGLMYCADCGNKMRLNSNNSTKGGSKDKRVYYYHNYTCGSYSRSGKMACNSHYIKLETIETLVLETIRSMINLLQINENTARQLFMEQKAKLSSKQSADIQKRYRDGKAWLTELEKLMQSIYEDKVLGKISEEVCVDLLEKYQYEKKELTEEIFKLENKLNTAKQDERDVDEFIRRLRKYENVEVLTSEMCLELIEYITIYKYSRENKGNPRDIHIYFKLLDKPFAGRKDTKIQETA